MDKKIKRKWLTRLRNGSYAQTSDSLVDQNGYCCLGVLCDIADPKGWKYRSNNDKWYHRGAVAMPGQDIYRLTGLCPALAGDLAAMNDEGSTFGQIAARIEKEA